MRNNHALPVARWAVTVLLAECWTEQDIEQLVRQVESGEIPWS